MKIPASKVPAQVWADKARRRADLDEVESMLLSSWDDSKQVYRIGKEDIAKDKTVATITWTFAAGNAAGGISVDDSWEGNHEMGID